MSKKLAWLVWRTGPRAGARHLLRGPVTRVGRSPDNDLILEGDDGVSARHCEIRREGDVWRLIDLDSTNGTWLDGRRVTECELPAAACIQLGSSGPELGFLLEELPATEVDRTMVLPPVTPQPRHTLPPLAGGAGETASPPSFPPPAAGPAANPALNEDELLLSEAVARARQARRSGIGDQTMVLMRDVLQAALHRSGRRFKRVIAALVAALVAVSAYGAWRISGLKREKASIDRQIRDLESALERGNASAAETDKLIQSLDQFQERARALQRDVFYRLGTRAEPEDYLRHAIRELMAEFGAEVYSIPPEFVESVQRYIDQYQGPNRPNMERALRRLGKDLGVLRQVFEEAQLPTDLVYIVLVESAFLSESHSPAGAAGLWQFTPRTARAYGLRVTDKVDERLDTRKATLAGSKYVRELILEFGAGSSVMLALAAYNSGPGTVRAAVRKAVANPIKQRDFWYLYRARALPAETREYVPKVIAAMLIGRAPAQFGF